MALTTEETRRLQNIGYNPQEPRHFFADIDKALEAFRAGRTEAKETGLSTLRQREARIREAGIDPSQLSEFQSYYSAFGGGQVPISPTTGGLQFTVPQTITSEIIAPTTTKLAGQVQSPPPFQPINIQGLSSDITTTPTLTGEAKTAQDINERLRGIYTELAGKAGFQIQQEQAQDIVGKERAFRDLSSQLFALKQEQASIPLQTAGVNQTAGMLGAQQAEQNRQIATRGLLVSAQLEAARGNLELALNTVDRAVRTKYATLEAERDSRIANYELIIKSPLFTAQEKVKAKEGKQQEEKAKDVDTFSKTIYTQISNLLLDQDVLFNAPASEKKKITDLLEEKTVFSQADFTTAVNTLGKYKKAPTTETIVSQDYNRARTFITDNPNATFAELRSGILENTKLSITDTDALLAAQQIDKSGLADTRQSIQKAKSLGFSRDDIEEKIKIDNGVSEIPTQIKSILDEIYGAEVNTFEWWNPLTWF